MAAPHRRVPGLAVPRGPAAGARDVGEHRRPTGYLAGRRCAQAHQRAHRRRFRHQRVLRPRRTWLLFEPEREGQAAPLRLQRRRRRARGRPCIPRRDPARSVRYTLPGDERVPRGVRRLRRDPDLACRSRGPRRAAQARSETVEDEFRRDADGVASERVEGSVAAQQRRRSPARQEQVPMGAADRAAR